MSSYEEIKYLLDISKQLTDMQETINKMSKIAGVFNLDAQLVNQLSIDAQAFQNNIPIDIKTLQDIQQRKDTGFQLPMDPISERQCIGDIQQRLRDYQQKFLPNYQTMVEQLIGKKDEIEQKVAEDRKAGKDVPNEKETKDALEEAGKKLQEAVKETPVLQQTLGTAKSFIEKAKPYVEPLIKAAKIALKLLVL